MRFSEDRISHLAHLITDSVWNDDLVDYTNEEKAISETKALMFEIFKHEDEADTHARDTIRSLSKHVPEGSREWDILYSQYSNEFMSKKGL